MNALAGKRVAVSLGASFMGYATHAGFLARLSKLGLRPVAVGGSSAGAIAAGMHAAGLPVEAIHQIVTGTALPLSFIHRTKWVWQQLQDIFSRRLPGLFDPHGAVAFFEQIIGPRRIEDLREPRLLIAMTDLKTGSALFVQGGPLAQAMAASSAVPLVFSDMEWEGRRVCDGGVMHEAPVDPWFSDPEIDVILIHRILHPAGRAPWFVPLRIIHTLACAHHCMNAQWLADRVELARLHGKELHVVTTVFHAPSILSRRSREACYGAGEATAQTFIDSQPS